MTGVSRLGGNNIAQGIAHPRFHAGCVSAGDNHRLAPKGFQPILDAGHRLGAERGLAVADTLSLYSEIDGVESGVVVRLHLFVAVGAAVEVLGLIPAPATLLPGLDGCHVSLAMNAPGRRTEFQIGLLVSIFPEDGIHTVAALGRGVGKHRVEIHNLVLVAQRVHGVEP